MPGPRSSPPPPASRFPGQRRPTRPKTPCRHAGRLEDPPLLFAQPLELMIDELSQALGQLRPDPARWRRPGHLRAASPSRPGARSSTIATMHKGLPSVCRWRTAPTHRAEPPGVRRSEPDGEISGDLGGLQKPSGKPLHCACASNSRTRARNGCAPAITSAGRYVPTTRSRAGARRRASIASNRPWKDRPSAGLRATGGAATRRS